MTKEEFGTILKKRIQEVLPEGEYEIETTEMLKANEQRRAGLVIHAEGADMAPVMYYDEAFHAFEIGEKSLDEILDELAVMYKSEIRMDFSRESLKDPSLLSVGVLNAEKNRELLKTLPHKEYGDLALYCYMKVQVNGIDGCVKVTEPLMERLGMTREEMFARAIENDRNQYYITHMANMIFMQGVSEGDYDFDHLERLREAEDSLFVLSNRYGQYGASCIARPELFEKIGNEFGNFYVIPSSIHEVLILPEDERTDSLKLIEMVRSVNENEVIPEERLSDNVYYWNAEKKRLFMVDEKDLKHTMALQGEQTTVHHSKAR